MKKIIYLYLLVITALSTSFLPQNTVIVNNIDNSEMILIPSGSFTFGLSAAQMSSIHSKYGADALNHFSKQSKVDLPAYYIDKYEITNQQFLKFFHDKKRLKSSAFNESFASQHPGLPVTNIGWEDARNYAVWSGKRLPSEEEWEKAARGRKNTLYPWGDNDNGSNYNGINKGKYAPVKVGSFPSGASDYGMMDMAGNVYEMTTGKWNGSYCMKGGSYLNKGAYTMSAFSWAPDDTVNGATWLGFRCVKDAR
jgi:formylglycine-generating enzyme required for sulfatase activity